MYCFSLNSSSPPSENVFITSRKFQFFFCFILLCISLTKGFSQNFQDCRQAFPVCELKTYHIGNVSGYGSLQKETTNLDCFNSNFKETNAFWFEWSVEEAGVITFVLDPNTQEDDLDFILFKKEDNDCSNLNPVRCMASGPNLGTVENRDCLGQTGLKINSVDEFESNGCKYNDDNYLKFIQVEKGETYSLLVNNYNSSDGFSISFEGDATLDDSEHCQGIRLENDVLITALYPNPANEIIHVDFITASLESVDIQIIDITGQLIYQTNENPIQGLNKKIIETGQLTPGTYLLKIKQNDYQTVKRFIKR